MRILALISLALSVGLLAACSSTSTPDLNITIVLHCGTNNDNCNVDGEVCDGSGRFNDLREDMNVNVTKMNGDLVDRDDASAGTFNASAGTCTFTSKHGMKSSSGYQIYAGDRGPFTVTKTTLEANDWTLTIELPQ